MPVDPLDGIAAHQPSPLGNPDPLPHRRRNRVNPPVHISAVERAGIMSLNEGQKVEYDLQPGRTGKSSAENLKLVD